MPENIVEVHQTVNEVRVSQIVQEVSIAATGPQGPPGPQGEPGLDGADGAPGAPGGTSYTYTTSSPSGTLTINHNLNRLVQVTILDTAGLEVGSDVDQSDPNTLVITFSQPFSGTVYLS